MAPTHRWRCCCRNWSERVQPWPQVDGAARNSRRGWLMQDDVERLLAQLLVDSDLRERFLLDPKGTPQVYGLSADECSAMAAISAPSLETAARSYERKRDLKCQHAKNTAFSGRLRRLVGAVLKNVPGVPVLVG